MYRHLIHVHDKLPLHSHSYCFACHCLFAKPPTETGHPIFLSKISSHTFAIASLFSSVKTPSSLFVKAAAFFKYANAYDWLWHFIDVLSDLKILNAALCLSAPIHICRHFHFAHSIFFYAVIHTCSLRLQM